MIDVYILDKNLRPVGIIDAYRSLIWANRYRDLGDCELYIPASSPAASLLKEGYYLTRLDDDMVCRIKKLEIDTDAEHGDYMIVTGQDVKGFLDQRIIAGTETCKGSLEDFARGLVTHACIDPANTDRKMLRPDGEPLLALDSAAGLPAVASGQVSYKNIGEKWREYCATYGYGYRARLDRAAGVFKVGMYEGTDRHSSVIFSPAFDNIATTAYIEDGLNLGNVAIVGGAGEGTARAVDQYGDGYGADRYEVFVDASDVTREISYLELRTVYPLTADGGTGYIAQESGVYVYKVGTLDIQVMSFVHLLSLLSSAPGGTEITVDGQTYYRLTDYTVAGLSGSDPADEDAVTLRDIIYDVYLLARGQESLAEYGRVTTFEGAIIPDITFVYRTDYFLGDIVTVENAYGTSIGARITEVVEVMDENGYSFEPTFEYVDIAPGLPEGAGNLLTENDADLLTEDDRNLIE